FGIGIMPDLMSNGDWKYVDAPGSANASYGLQQQHSAIYAVRMVGGVAYAVTKKLSVGGTFGVDYNWNTLHAPYIFQSQPVVAGLKTLPDQHTNGFGRNYGVGVMFQPSIKLQLGAAWRSRTVIDSTGHASGDINAQFAALGVSAPSDFTYSAAVRSVLPQSVT